MKRITGTAAALIAAALIGGTIISSVMAAGPEPAADPTDAGVATATLPAAGALPPAGALPAAAPAAAAPTAAAPAAAAPAAAAPAGKYCDTFRAAFAAELGVDEAKLESAAKSAANSTIDAAVAADDLTANQGDRLKARVASAEGDACRWYAGVVRRAAGAVHALKDAGAAAAEALGITPAELRTALRAGTTLKELASTRNVPYETVSSAVVAAVKADLDAAIANGTIRQARADRILDRLERALANGTIRAAR